MESYLAGYGNPSKQAWARLPRASGDLGSHRALHRQGGGTEYLASWADVPSVPAITQGSKLAQGALVRSPLPLLRSCPGWGDQR